jgi:selenophosphate synthase
MKTTAVKKVQALVFDERVFFVPKGSQTIDSLFSGPVTASGTFKVRKNGIMFYDLKGHERVFLAANKHSQPFLVSCVRELMKNGKTRTRYMYAICALDELWLNLRGASWSELAGLSRRLWTEVSTAP